MPTSALTLIRGRADVGIGPYDHTNPDLMSLYGGIHTKEAQHPGLSCRGAVLLPVRAIVPTNYGTAQREIMVLPKPPGKTGAAPDRQSRSAA